MWYHIKEQQLCHILWEYREPMQAKPPLQKAAGGGQQASTGPFLGEPRQRGPNLRPEGSYDLAL